MKTIKLKLVANKLGSWKSLPDKIADLKKWAKGIDLQITLQYTVFEDIPFSTYNDVLIDQYNYKLMSTQVKGVDFLWYDENISSKAKDYDIVLFALSLDQWKVMNVRGWRTDRNNGPIELQVASDEKTKTGEFNNFLMFAKHEIAHALYMMTEQTDKTHDYFYNGDYYCEQIWNDLQFKEPNWTDNPVLWAWFLNLLATLFKQNQMQEEIKEEAPKPKLDDFCLAIQKHEGWFEGSRSWRNRNPGNLRYVGQAKAIGADKSNFAIFATYEDGFNTLKGMIKNAVNGLSKVYTPEDTFTDFFSKYAPSFDHNDPQNYAQVVAKSLGVGADYKIKDLV
jgi:hypothetical protein